MSRLGKSTKIDLVAKTSGSRKFRVTADGCGTALKVTVEPEVPTCNSGTRETEVGDDRARVRPKPTGNQRLLDNPDGID